MKVIVTGGAGFIGSHLCELLLQQGCEVVALDNLQGGRKHNLSSILQHPKFSLVVTDIRNRQEIDPHFIGVDWVFHLAGLADIVPSIDNPELYYQTNVTGTLNVLECCRNHGIKRMVYAASSSCYGIPDRYPTDELQNIRPQYPYALTKYLGEQLAMHWCDVYGLPVVSLRLFNVYGPRVRTNGTYGAVFGVFLAQKINNKAMTVVGDGKQTRDFTFVTDVARAFFMAAQSNCSKEIMNIGSGGHYSVNQLVSLLGGTPVYIPKRPGEPDCTFADISKIESVLNWKPEISFEVGVKLMLDGIEQWRDAPLWDPKSIKQATQSWFKFLEERDDADQYNSGYSVTGV